MEKLKGKFMSKRSIAIEWNNHRLQIFTCLADPVKIFGNFSSPLHTISVMVNPAVFCVPVHVSASIIPA